MKGTRKLVAAAGTVAVGLGGLAAPAGSAEKEAFPIVCEGVTYTITTGNGNWAVGKDTQSSTHFIPSAFTFRVTDQAGNVVFQESIRKKGHRNQKKITCTFSDTFTEDGQTFHFTGTATVVKKP